jgi:hypothetical protein
MNRKLLNDSDRISVPAKIFGVHFPFRVEPSIYNIASILSGEYSGGYWLMYELENGGFYMAPNLATFQVLAENGYEGTMSGDAFGITVCLYVYSELSFLEVPGCAEQYHRLREFVFEHPEREAIFRAID